MPLSSDRSLISVRRKPEDDAWYHEWGENLEASQENVVYIGEALMIVLHNGNTNKTKKQTLEFMKRDSEEFQDNDTIRPKANVLYQGLGETHSEPLFKYEVSLESYGGMRTVLEHGRQYNQSMDMSLSDEVREFEGW